MEIWSTAYYLRFFFNTNLGIISLASTCNPTYTHNFVRITVSQILNRSIFLFVSFPKLSHLFSHVSKVFGIRLSIFFKLLLIMCFEQFGTDMSVIEILLFYCLCFCKRYWNILWVFPYVCWSNSLMNQVVFWFVVFALLSFQTLIVIKVSRDSFETRCSYSSCLRINCTPTSKWFAFSITLAIESYSFLLFPLVFFFYFILIDISKTMVVIFMLNLKLFYHSIYLFILWR